jgi:hypothetical protein
MSWRFFGSLYAFGDKTTEYAREHPFDYVLVTGFIVPLAMSLSMLAFNLWSQ